jgi:excisionase family DNA binding protein
MSERDYVTVSELAELANLTPMTIRRAIASGRLDAYRVGAHRIRIKKVDAQRFIEGEPVPVVPPKP